MTGLASIRRLLYGLFSLLLIVAGATAGLSMWLAFETDILQERRSHFHEALVDHATWIGREVEKLSAASSIAPESTAILKLELSRLVGSHAAEADAEIAPLLREFSSLVEAGDELIWPEELQRLLVRLDQLVLLHEIRRDELSATIGALRDGHDRYLIAVIASLLVVGLPLMFIVLGHLELPMVDDASRPKSSEKIPQPHKADGEPALQPDSSDLGENRVRPITAAIFVVAGLAFAADLMSPLGVAGGVPYVAVVLLSLWLPRPGNTWLVAVLASLLIALGFALSPAGSVLWIVLTNRGLALLAVWVTAFLSLSRKGAEVRLTTALKDLRSTNDRLEVAAREASTQARLASRASSVKSNFLANISHEIRTPMNAVLGFAEILADTDLDDRQADHVATIRASARTLLRLIDDVLDLSRVEAGRLPLHYTTMDLRETLEQTVQLLSAKARDKGNSLQWHTDGDVPAAILLDEVRLRQILLNLVGNAVKFTSSGFIRLNAMARAIEGEPDWIALSICVEDSGCGIAAADQERIFSAFEQRGSVDTAPHEGTGLGLSISRGLSTLLKGTLNVSSEVGVGSRFQLDLPRVRRMVARSPAAGEKGSRRLRLPAPATVLIVDDSHTNRALFRAFLEGSGLELHEAIDGAEAIRAAKALRPDLILMDVRMPVMDGVEASGRIKADADLSHIPVIGITASGTAAAQRELESCFDQLLVKPVSKETLLVELDLHLGNERYAATSKRAEPSSPPARSCETDVPLHPARLCQLHTRLEREFRQVWEELRDGVLIDEIARFAERLADLGSEYGYPPLQVWSARVRDLADSFDVEGLSNSLPEFPKLVKRLAGVTEEVHP